MSELDDDTALAADGPGRYKGNLTDRWIIGAGLNGGYLMSILTRAIKESAAQPHLLTMTTHFVSRVEPGPVTVEVETVRRGRSHETMTARLLQDGAVALAIATCGRRRDGQPSFLRLRPPGPLTPEISVARSAPVPLGMTFLDRFDYRFSPDAVPVPDQPGRNPVFQGWVKLRDRDLDEVAVPLLADCFPPPVFAALGAGLAPTLELTVHWRGEPAPGWTQCRFESRVLSGGYVEEDGELWTESGELVAQSRQLSRFTALT